MKLIERLEAAAIDDSAPPEALHALFAGARGRALAAMSGGVDSAVATVLAVEGGYDAVGLTMRLWTPGEGELEQKVRQCCGPTAYADARRAASLAGIPYYVVNFESAFHRAVVDYFCGEYLAGRTPNPCVACNNLVKFGALLKFTRALGAQTIITGHYARVRRCGDGPHLLRAVDRSKDQSYMLAGLRPDQLASMVLPLGDFTKEATRRLAREREIDIAEKPESMDLCFVDGNYRAFIRRRFPDAAEPGPIVTTDGRQVGRHQGLLEFTVGQRRGIPVSGLSDGPWFVIRTQRETNAVVIGRREELARDGVRCSNANLIRPDLFEGGRSVRGRAICRYRATSIEATAVARDGRLDVQFAKAVPVVTPGQLLVLYDPCDEEVLASGIIENDL